MKDTTNQEPKSAVRTSAEEPNPQSSFEESSRILAAMLFEAEQLEQLRREEERLRQEAERQRIEEERIRLERQFTND